MEITVARNAEEILSLSASRKSTSPRPRLTWTRVPSNIPPQPRKDAIPKYAMMGNTPTAASNGRRPYLVPPGSGGSPGEADDEIVASQQDSEIGQGHPALLPVFLVHPEHHQPAGPPGDQIEEHEPRRGVPYQRGREYLLELFRPFLPRASHFRGRPFPGTSRHPPRDTSHRGAPHRLPRSC